MHSALIIIASLNYQIKVIRSDCGPPGKSSGAEFSPVLSQRYPELFAVTYRCQDRLRLFTIYGENRRVCRNGTWIGELPKCAKMMETDENFKHYQILNHTTKVEQNSHKWSLNVELIYRIGFENLGNHYIDKCSETYQNLGNSQTWIFDVLAQYHNVRYAQLLFIGWPLAEYNSPNDTIKFGFWTSRYKFISEFKLIAFNQYNLSHSGLILTSVIFVNPILINYGFGRKVKCGGPWKSSSLNYPPMSVTLSLSGNRFAGNIRFCAIDLYSLTTSCGTPDIPLHAQIVLIDYQSAIECHRFVCNKNYRLVGHSDIECSSLHVNDWIGETPKCVPNITCDRDNLTQHSSLLEVSYQNTETFNGEHIAVIDSIETYSCNGSATLIGRSQRICLENGTWDQLLPNCVHLQTGSQSSLSFIIITLSVLLFCTLLAFAIALLYYYFNRRKSVKVNNQMDEYYENVSNDNFDKNVNDEYYQEIDENDNVAHNYYSAHYSRNEDNAESENCESPQIYLAID